MREKRLNTIIIGAAGRDFHNFNTYYRDNNLYHVAAFTAAQIPDIDERMYPPELAGSLYPKGIPIHSQEDLPKLIKELDVDQCAFSYSDISYNEVMSICSIVNNAGADFLLIGPKQTTIKSTKPVISVCAVRTGCGKSQTTRHIIESLMDMGKKVVAIRHPMPYGNLVEQRVQRFAKLSDLDNHNCTIEEMEEYEPHIIRGNIIYAGIDYEAILREAEKEADIIIWDGGNNDFPFYVSDLVITVADPHRAGHELTYYPGETTLRMADIIVINKMETADSADIQHLRENISMVNPTARVVDAASPVSVDFPERIKGKRVLVVEDGPTLSHGNMKYGAAAVAAKKFGASDFVDPRDQAVGKIKETFETYPDIGLVLPAMGYGEEQIHDLEATIRSVKCDTVVVGTPIDLTRVIKIDQDVVKVGYDLQEIGRPTLRELLEEFLEHQ